MSSIALSIPFLEGEVRYFIPYSSVSTNYIRLSKISDRIVGLIHPGGQQVLATLLLEPHTSFLVVCRHKPVQKQSSGRLIYKNSKALQEGALEFRGRRSWQLEICARLSELREEFSDEELMRYHKEVNSSNTHHENSISAD